MCTLTRVSKCFLHIFSRNNFLRLCVLKVTQQSEKHLEKILNVDEYVNMFVCMNACIHVCMVCIVCAFLCVVYCVSVYMYVCMYVYVVWVCFCPQDKDIQALCAQGWTGRNEA